MPADAESDAANSPAAADYDPDPALTQGRRCVKILVAGAVAVLVLLVAVHTVIVVRTGADVQAELELLKAGGAPMTIDELLGPAPAPEENAASDLVAAFIAMTQASGSPYVPHTDSGTLGPAMKAINDASGDPIVERHAIYKANQDDPDVVAALAALDAATAKPRCRFDLPWDEGPMMLMPYLSMGRIAARLLAADALAKAVAGDEDAAWARIHQGLILARHIGETPNLIGYLVATTLESITLNAALEIQPWVRGPQPPWLLAQSGRFDSHVDPSYLVAAFDGERITIGNYVFDMMNGSSADVAEALELIGETRGPSRWYASYPMKPLRHIDQRTYLSIMRKVRETLVTRTYDLDVLTRPDFDEVVPRYFIMTRELTPSIKGTTGNRGLLKQRLLRLVLFACDYRRRTGAFPADLDALVKALPPNLAAIAKDPALVTPPQPLIYQTEGETLTLYGYSTNNRDDGGDPIMDTVVTIDLTPLPPVDTPAEN